MHASNVRRSPLVNKAIGAALLLLLLIELSRILGHVGSDFKIFYHSAARFNTDPSLLYSSDSIATLQGYLYPPPAIMILKGLPFFGLSSAYAIFICLLYGLIAASAVIWMKVLEEDSGLVRFTPGEKIVGVLAALAAGPVFSAAASGQVDALILFICSLYVLLLRKEHFFSAGFILSVGFWIKIYPILLLIYVFSGKGRLSLVTGFLSGLLLVPIGLTPWIPGFLYVDYFLNYLPNFSKGTIVNIYNQSLSAFLMRMAFPASSSLSSFDAIQVTGWIRVTVFAAACAFLLCIGSFVRHRRLRMIALAVAVSASSWLAPLGWGHTYVYVLPMVVLLWGVCGKSPGAPGSYLFWATYLAMALPVYHHFSWLPSTSGLLGNTVYSRYLLFVLIFSVLSIAFMVRAGNSRTPVERVR